MIAIIYSEIYILVSLLIHKILYMMGGGGFDRKSPNLQQTPGSKMVALIQFKLLNISQLLVYLFLSTVIL